MDDFSCLVFDIKEIKKDDFCPLSLILFVNSQVYLFITRSLK